MKISDIVSTIKSKAIIDIIYKEWLHEGMIDIVDEDNFRCVIDGRLYEISVEEIEKVR